ncbi:cell death regulator Aven isoform 1-T3 [Pholidichthys leucotaenia]
MEGRPSRGRWKRGGRGGNDSDDQRDRGRPRHHRGRGRRDHHRGRGRAGAGAQAAEFHQREQDDDISFQEEDDGTEVFSSRKLGSNWDRYEESEKQESNNDVPTQRGTNYHVLLESAGDSVTQFRFSEEKDWDKDTFTANQMPEVFVDPAVLCQMLQQLPLHQRLDLEAELVQVSAPAELPSMTFPSKQEVPKTSKFTPPPAISVAPHPAMSLNLCLSSAAVKPPEDDYDELDELLSLQKPVPGAAGNEPVSAAYEEEAAAEEAQEEEEEVVSTEEEKAKDAAFPPPASATLDPEVDWIEDWLDSMI